MTATESTNTGEIHNLEARAQAHPQLLELTRMLSRHAKNKELYPEDREALYEIKDALMQVLFKRGEIIPAQVLEGPWEFGQNLTDYGLVVQDGIQDTIECYEESDIQKLIDDGAHPWRLKAPSKNELEAFFAQMLQEAREKDQIVNWQEFARRGIELWSMPMEYGRHQTNWDDLSKGQLRQLHPKGSWLVAFAEPSAPDNHILHAPYPNTQAWLSEYPQEKSERSELPYGRPPNAQEQSQWPLRRIINELGIPETFFPRRLATRIRHSFWRYQDNFEEDFEDEY